MLVIDHQSIVDHGAGGIYCAIVVHIAQALTEASVYEDTLYLVATVDMQIEGSWAEVEFVDVVLEVAITRDIDAAVGIIAIVVVRDLRYLQSDGVVYDVPFGKTCANSIDYQCIGIQPALGHDLHVAIVGLAVVFEYGAEAGVDHGGDGGDMVIGV